MGTTSVYSPTNGGQVPCVVQDAGNHRTSLVVNNQTNDADAGSALILAAHGQDWQLEATSVLKGNRDFTIKAGTNERLRIDNDGRFLVGTSSAAKTYVSLGLQGNGASATNQATIALAKGALPSGTDQELGRIEFFDNSGNSGGTIVGISDAAWTSGSSHATKLTFSTTASGASSPTERMRIDSEGKTTIQGSGTSNNPFEIFTLKNTETSSSGQSIQINLETNRNSQQGISKLKASLMTTAAPLFCSSILRNTGLKIKQIHHPTRQSTARGGCWLGASSSRGTWFNLASTFTPSIQVEGTGAPGGQYMSITANHNASGFGGRLLVGKTRGSAVGATAAVQSGDEIGGISLFGSDGSEMVEAANIVAYVDGTPGSNDMPGRLLFSTTADGASSPTERARITEKRRIPNK